MTVTEIQKYFEPIVGYAHVKEELIMLCHMLVNPDKYEKLGANSHQNIILIGEPGLGKTLLCSCFIKATGRQVYKCTKNKSSDDFVNHITKSFTEAVNNAPSIVFLDDIDKFANSDLDHCDSEEYVTVQSCIDEIRGKDVVVLATCNNSQKLPQSLLRPGRFDKKINIERPAGKDAEMITNYYISNKLSSIQIDKELFGKMLRGYTCAEIESVINEAAIYASFNNRQEIGENDIIKAIMRIIYQCNDSACNNLRTLKDIEAAAIHEAGHAIISDYLNKGSVIFISIQKQKEDSSIGGFTSLDTNICSRPKTGYKHLIDDCLVGIAGLCAVEEFYKQPDAGAQSDLHTTSEKIVRFFESSGMHDFATSVCSTGYYTTSEFSKTLNFHECGKFLRACKKKCMKIIKKNKKLIRAVADKLIQSENISYRVFEEIKHEVSKR